jgi:hypothetical protein
MIGIDSNLHVKNSCLTTSIMKSITNFYKCDFPYIKIKTESGEVKGQLKDIQNKSFSYFK